MKIPIVNGILAFLSVVLAFGSPALTTIKNRVSVADLIVVGMAADSATINIEAVLKGSHDSGSVMVTEKFGYDENCNQ